MQAWYARAGFVQIEGTAEGVVVRAFVWRRLLQTHGKHAELVSALDKLRLLP